MGYIIVGITVLAGIGFFICVAGLYRANKRMIKRIEKRQLESDRLSRILDGLKGSVHFIEIYATENYFPKE